jgi:cobalt-zinc-cadmium resistance protein CzcA
MSARASCACGRRTSTSSNPMLRTVQGVAEINSNGGHQRQVTVEPMLDKLKAANMTVGELADIIRGNVENAGGGVINRDGEQLTIRSVGRVSTAEEIAKLPIKFGAAVQPMKVEDVAKVQWGRLSAAARPRWMARRSFSAPS